MLTREERERRVIEMYEEGKTYRDIIKEVHMSPGNISSIIKRHTGELQAGLEKGEQQHQQETIDTKVFELFEEGKSPVQVAIDLNLPSTEVTRLQSEYRKLIGLQELNQLQEEIGVDIFEFSRTYKFTKSHGFTPRQLIDTADHLDDLPLLRSEKEQLVQENQNLQRQNENKTLELDQINEKITIARQNLNSINAGIQESTKAIDQLRRRKLQIQTVIVNMNTGPGYQRIQEIAEAATRNILKQNQVVLTAACHAIFQALKEEPRNELQSLIYGSLSYPFYQPGNGRKPQNYLQLRQAMLLEAAEEMYKELLDKAVNTTMSSALYPQSDSGQPLNWNDYRYRR